LRERRPSGECRSRRTVRQAFGTVLQSIAIAVHELTTNAVKYGALSVPTGHVQVEWSRSADRQVALRWAEAGGPAVTPPVRQGFGTRVIERMIRSQLKGEVRFDWRSEGLLCEIVAPELDFRADTVGSLSSGANVKATASYSSGPA
jgi:two-component sensor histidine kinase